MFIEIIITLIIFTAAGYFLFKNIKKSSSGKCTSCKDNTKKSPSYCSHCNGDYVNK